MVSVLGFSFSGQGQNAALAFVHAEGLGRAQGRASTRRRRWPGRAFGALLGHPRRLHLPAEPAADPRARHRHRLHLPPAGPRRQRPRRAGRRAQPAAGHGRARASCSPACAPTAWKTRRSCRSTSTATRPTRWASPSRRSTPRCRRRSARPTSTTSRTAAACSAWWCRPMRRRACSRTTCCSSTRSTPRASRCRCRRSPRTRWVTGADADRALQRLPGDAHLRRRRAGLQHRRRRWTRWSGWRRSCRRASASNGPASRARRSSPARRPSILLGFSLLAVFLCLAALYESWSIPLSVILVVPLGVLGRAARRHAARHAERRVLQGRPDHHHRPVGEERDPDHRVRQGPAGAGQGPDRGGARGRPPALPPDPHDLAGLHPRRAAAGASPPAPARPASAPSAPA